MPIIPGVMPVPVIQKPSLSYITSVGDATDLTTYTFVGVSLGAADVNRSIIVIPFLRATVGVQVNSVSVAGITAQTVIEYNVGEGGGHNGSGVYLARVPTGTSGDIVVTASVGCLRCGVNVFRVTNLLSTIAVDTNSNNQDTVNVNINALKDGFIVAGYFSGRDEGGGAAPATWTGLDEVADSTVENRRYTAAMRQFAAPGSKNVQMDLVGFVTNGTFVAASFR